jgi:hypothetical protein
LYLDPPFNSRHDYNFLFAEKDGTRAAAQIMAFEDTWEWNIDAEKAYQEIIEHVRRHAWISYVPWQQRHDSVHGDDGSAPSGTSSGTESHGFNLSAFATRSGS